MEGTSAMRKDSFPFRSKYGAAIGLCILALFTVPSLPAGPGGSLVQKGMVTVVDGGEAKVTYPKPFQTPPRLVITGFNQSWFKQKPYRLSDFQIVQQEAGYFRIQSNHGEVGAGSWAVLEWRAEGTQGLDGVAGKKGVELTIAKIEQWKGQVTRDAKLPERPVISVDLHHTHITDSDLEVLESLKQVRTLNLYGTSITDAGLAHLTGLTKLETVHLSSTAVTGSGLQYLGRLPGLRDLNLHQTHVVDEDLRYLGGLSNLQKLTLSDTQVSDRGLQHLKGLRKLRFLLVSRTNVTDAGVQELQRALPDLHIIR